MDNQIFNKFRNLVYETSGIALTEKKEALVAARIGKRMRALGIENHKEYLKYIHEDNSGEEIVQMLDAISTNVTSFFRESAHFDFVGDVFLSWLQSGIRRFRFWSAASSTGEEPYSLAMVLKNVSNCHNADIRILATDISTRVLDRCKSGLYKAEKAESIPKQLRDRFCKPVYSNGQKMFGIDEEIKKMISFSRINLSQTPFPMHGPFDIIFCRNVMIYFDNTIRTKLLNDILRLLKPGGYLIVGHAESLTGMISGFKSIKPSIYMRP